MEKEESQTENQFESLIENAEIARPKSLGHMPNGIREWLLFLWKWARTYRFRRLY